jgi:hypothetical protein
MKDILKLIGTYVDDIVSVLFSLIAVGAVAGILFPNGLFGMDVIGNLISLVDRFGNSGFSGFIALVVLIGLIRK